MGSTQTGPMFDGGDATCAKGRFSPTYPYDDAEWRALIFKGANCKDYSERKDL